MEVDPEKLRATAPSHLSEDPLFPFFKGECEALVRGEMALCAVLQKLQRDAAS